MMKLTLRAWDKSRNKMITNPRYQLHISDAHSSVLAINYDKEGYEQVLDLMVGTGIEDSKGYEIFEGDFITCGCYTWQVIFSNGMFKGKRLSSQHGHCVIIEPLYQIVRFSITSEIIGNIYEGLEL